jgi:hypothetical protein
MQSVGDIEPIDRIHFGCFVLFICPHPLVLMGDWLTTGQSHGQVERGEQSQHWATYPGVLGPLSRPPRAVSGVGVELKRALSISWAGACVLARRRHRKAMGALSWLTSDE